MVPPHKKNGHGIAQQNKVMALIPLIHRTHFSTRYFQTADYQCFFVDQEVFANYIMKAKKKADKEASKAVDNAIQEEFDSIDAARQMSKEDVMSELVRIAFKMPANDPKRADILMKYADLTQMKKDEVDKEEKTVHTYLPLTCKDCPLYVKHKRRQNG